MLRNNGKTYIQYLETNLIYFTRYVKYLVP